MNAPAPLPYAHPGRSQATQIEQTRAAAEVFAAVLAAREMPRDEQRARTAMLEACKQRELAERAFYRYNRGGEQVSGGSIHLARELARCWGNLQYGVQELDRDDRAGRSEMQAFAWDLETNTRPTASFIVPHARDTKRGRKDLTDLRDIYENNANNGARRLREQIFSLLPVWFVEQGKNRCMKTLEDGGEVPLADRIATAIERFAGLGVSDQQLAEKVGRPVGKWTALDLAPLTVIYQSIRRGEATVEDEFPPIDATVTISELGQRPAEGVSQQARTVNVAVPAAEPERPAEQPTDESAPQAGETSEPAKPGALPKPGTAAWHSDRHPRPGRGEKVLRVDRLMNGDCGICEQDGAGK